MDWIIALTTIFTALILPFAIQVIKSESVSPNVARWLAIIISVLFGLLGALANGIPMDPGSIVTFILAFVGGVQVAYSGFKSIGITSKWLDNLLAIGTITKTKE